MTDDGKRCGVMDANNRRACELDQGHAGMHKSDAFMWKDPPKRAVKSKPEPTPKAKRPAPAPKASAKPAKKSQLCSAPWVLAADGTKLKKEQQLTCARMPGHEGTHRAGSKDDNHVTEWLDGVPGAVHIPRVRYETIDDAPTVLRDEDELEPGADAWTVTAAERDIASAAVEAVHAIERSVADEGVTVAIVTPANPKMDKSVHSPIATIVTAAKIGTHAVHPAAALFPMISDDAWATFLEDVRTSGQRKKIVQIDAGGSWQILDGRNRLRACLELGIQPRFRVFGDEPGDGKDPIAFVVSENIHRRHLNETQRAFVGAELVPMYETQAKDRQRMGGKEKGSANVREASKASESAAKAVNVSARSIEAALKVNRDAAPEVIAASKDRGELKVSAAAELSTLPKDKQREIVEKMGAGEMRAGRVRAHVKQEKKRDVVRTINEERIGPIPEGPFRVIVCDWPWLYDNSDQHEGSRGHIPYPGMSTDQAFAMTAELEKLAHEDGCVLGFWTTNAFMPDAVRIVEAWGFTWRTIRTWDKERDGIGTWCRSRTEHLIIAERGEVEHTLNEVSTLIREMRREHSRKPEEPMATFEAHCSGPYLEMFAREPRENWATWGAEADKFATEAA